MTLVLIVTGACFVCVAVHAIAIMHDVMWYNTLWSLLLIGSLGDLMRVGRDQSLNCLSVIFNINSGGSRTVVLLQQRAKI